MAFPESAPVRRTASLTPPIRDWRSQVTQAAFRNLILAVRKAVISGEWREKEFEERSRSSAVLGSAEPSGMQNTQMTVGGVWFRDDANQRFAPPIGRLAFPDKSGGFLEFEFGGVAKGVEDAKEEIGGDVFGITVHDGGDAGAGSTSEASDLSVRQALALNDFDDF